MMDTIIHLDEQFFLFLNQFHTSWLDPIMLALTGRFIWIPLYIFLLYHIIKAYRISSIWYIIGLGIVILIADQFTSGFMKPYFERLRPCHDSRWDAIILNYAGCGGRYGFASSHAANTFALAAFSQKVGERRITWFRWLFLWAAIVSYTRIYLGVHYPGDILVGALVGLLVGWLVYWLVSQIKIRWENRKSKNNFNTP